LCLMQGETNSCLNVVVLMIRMPLVDSLPHLQ
jgi:hypothetical protein